MVSSIGLVPKPDLIDGGLPPWRNWKFHIFSRLSQIAPLYLKNLGLIQDPVVMSPGFLNPVAAAGVPIINLHPALPGMLVLHPSYLSLT
jgi:hypothetical protein